MCSIQKSLCKVAFITIFFYLIKVSVTEIFYKIFNFFLSPFDEIKGEFSNGEFFMFVFCREVYLFSIKYYFYFFVN